VAGLIAPLAGLKLSILRHSSPGLRRTGHLLGLAGVAGGWAAAVAAGSDAARRDVLLLLAAGWAVGWLVGPMLASGTGVLRPEFFRLLPERRRRLSLGLLAVSFVGFGPAVSLLTLAALGVHAVALDPVTLLVAVPGLLLLLAFMVTLSRLFFAVVGAAMRSRLGVEVSSVQYGALVASLFVGWLAVGPAQDTALSLVRDGLPDGPLAAALAALPTGWPVHATEAAAAGRWGTAAGWLGALAALTGVLVAAAAVLLAPRAAGPAGRRRRRAGWSPPPATPLGAVVGKELRLWRRDPWRRLELRTEVWAALFAGALALLAGYGWAAPLAGLIAAFGVAFAACNLYGQDGTALWLTVVGAGPDTARVEVRGRQLAVLLMTTPAALALPVGFGLLAGEGWVWPVVLSLVPALLGAGAGLGLLLSVVAATPGVDPRQRVGPNDAGDVTFQVFASLLVVPVLVAPVAVLATAAAASGAAVLSGLAVAAGVGHGGLLAWWLGRLAHRRLAARLPETFVRLRYGTGPAAGGGWLGRLERQATETNQERKPVGS
jgi:ABC-2 type transport system permease protein